MSSWRGSKTILKVWRLAVAAGLLAFILAWTAAEVRDRRGAGPAEGDAANNGPVTFDPAEAAALCVGIEKFEDNSVEKVQFAVDDAVDLAYAFAIEMQLVSPTRLILALNGTPKKPASKERLQKLKDAGATLVAATSKHILESLQQQARAAGRRGLLIVTFATHGFSEKGTPYLLASTSTFPHTDTSLSASDLLDFAAQTGAARSLILIDACRERISTARSGLPDPISRALFMDRMNKTRGQAVLWAAAAGGYAYDDPDLKNGVFTHYVLKGLRCGAAKDGRGFITFNTLASYVEQNVRQWIVTHRRKDVGSATQQSVDGSAEDMPLILCERPPEAAAPPPPNPATVKIAGNSLQLFSPEQIPLGRGTVRGTIADSKIADLLDDGVSEAVIGVADGEDAGNIIVLDGNGRELWRRDVNDGLPAARMGITALLAEPFVRGSNRRQIAALSSLGAGSRLTFFEPDGTRHKPLSFARHMSMLMFLETGGGWSKLVAAGGDVVVLVNPYKLEPEELWSTRVPGRVERLEIADCNADFKPDIRVGTSGGPSCLDREGNLLSPATNRR